jgi:glycosyltransferase involved in cell wall biosynthesis
LLAPSRAEGFGLPVLEAFAAGVPVVCSDAPALVEVSAGAALLTPIGDAGTLALAIRRLLGEAGLAAELSARGLERARSFRWAAVAGRVREVLLDVTGPA